MKKSDIDFSNIPDAPGVYFFRDGKRGDDTLGEILYIGKATSLRNRIKSYFDKDLVSKRGLKIVNMVLAAKEVTYEETANVLEALLYESHLIKLHQPNFNTKEKDDKSFSSVIITKEDYPRVLVMRIREYEKLFGKSEVDKIYGPFSSVTQLRDIMKLVRKIFPYRDKCEVASGKLCFNAQIGLCPGCCNNLITSKEYKNTSIKNIKKLFEGEHKAIRKELETEMKNYAKLEKFELAAKTRNTLWAMDHVNDVSLIKNENIESFKDKKFRIESYDVAHMSGGSRVGVMTVVEDGKVVKSEYKKFKLEENTNDDYAGIREMISRRLHHEEWRLPDIIVFDGGKAQKQVGEKAIADFVKEAENNTKFINSKIDYKKILSIQTVSVIKDEKHNPKDILGPDKLIKEFRDLILLANSEAHRFAIKYHKEIRLKKLLNI